MKKEYITMVELIRNRHKEVIVEADANPDTWYELFVDEGEAGTHTVESADTFNEIVPHIEKNTELYGIENINIDIWENRKDPNNLKLLDTATRRAAEESALIEGAAQYNPLNQNFLARVVLWVNNYGDGEGLTRELFSETYGKVMGDHYTTKWESTYRHNILAMVGYFGYGSKDGQKFCDMILRQMIKYEQRINEKRNG